MPTPASKSDTRKVPKLRFPGFEGEWEEKKMKDISKIYDGTHKTPNYVKEGVPFYSVEHITANDFSNAKFISNNVFQAENKRVKIERNDILMTRIGDIGTAKLIDWNAKASFYVSLALIKQSDKINPNFLSKTISFSGFQKELWKRTIHAAFPKKINLGEIGECKLLCPSHLEQKQIADFLISIDQWLDLLRAQKETLESYKKGMMQKIFTQEIRFKDDDGKEFPEWDEKRLGEVFSFMPTNSLSRSQLNYEVGTIKNIHYGDIHTKFGLRFDICKEALPYINVEIDMSKIKPEAFCLEGDIVLADASEDYKDIGKTIELLHLKDSKVLAGLHTLLLRPQFSLAKGFAGSLMNTSFVHDQIMGIASGISVLGVSKSNLSKIDLILPIFPEQQKIADFLTSIDNLIDSKQKQISLAEQWKKGLMQNLFV